MLTTSTGTNHFVAHWAANTRALTNKTPLPSFDQPRLDRSPLCFHGLQPSAKRMIELHQEIGFVHHAGEGDKPPPATEPISLITLHFPRSKLASLKADAAPAQVQAGHGRRDSAFVCLDNPGAVRTNGVEESHVGRVDEDTNAKVPWVSTYDAIIATIWRAVTRARMPVFQSLPSGVPATSSQLHAVNLRSVAGVPESFYGNAMALPTQTLPISILTSLPLSSNFPDPNLTAVSAAIRAGITRCSTPEIVNATAEWVAGTENKNSITLPNLIGTGLYCTSWRSMTYYQVADFGFGRPNRVRRPPLVADGIVFVYPTRPPECGAKPDEGTDVVLGLAQRTAKRFLKDDELLRYARVIEG